ncbi:transcriptional regulator, LysR family [Anaeromyxobacter dehalogenans 2CP-1]|uniref:Transcriptional regulator, LysR family n=1 Tax=Anaeromyxobacter dehalogenans (strain ATCC BAA-258 / DSM 21875 / 2CP-1) TaxID=455488 RepID=B8J505_ANAD2|nr:LysR family transcriptional regulator [Anaeromyxobacter dehalogenans]ACL64860.1 transcriptional regulator, LysR family [Anaeromyxobacter dehalogenans 2CP-1]
MDLAQLELLAAVAEERSFTRAAERLHRTQPAVSQALRRLEEEVGATLVDRSSRDASLTAEGKVLHEYAQRMLKLRRDAGEALEALRGLQRGTVVVAANEFTATHLLPVLAEFRRRHPHLRVEVHRSLARDIPTAVLGRDAELGVLTYRATQPGLVAQQIAIDDLVLLVPPEHPLARRGTVSIRQLGGESFLAHHVRSPNRERVVKAFARHRTTLDIVMELPTLDAVKRLVVERVGIALMPARVAEPELARGELVGLTVREMRFPRPVLLVHRRDAPLSRAAEALLECAREVAPRGAARTG